MDITTVNVFSLEDGIGGNPCAIVDNCQPLTEQEMQALAKHLDFPETVFILKNNDKYTLRFFATKGELPLCCHGSLGAAFYLAKKPGSSPFSIHSHSGIPIGIKCTNTTAAMSVANGHLIEKNINFNDITTMLRLDEAAIDGAHPLIIASIGSPKLLIPVLSRKILFAIDPNNAFISDWCRHNAVNGLYVYSMDTIKRDSDYIARNFNPLFSDKEDVATGVAAATLCQAMQLVLNNNPSTKSYVIEQGANLGRPSKIYVSVSPHDVWISGQVSLVE